MADHPILFQADMVNAILAGKKTMTRRIIKPQPDHKGVWSHWSDRSGGIICSSEGDLRSHLLACSKYQVGDRLWVRENFRPVHSGDPSRGAKYKADVGFDQTKWKPSIHMPRIFSRITLIITEVVAEQLRDMTDDDALCEGIIPIPDEKGGPIERYTVYPKNSIDEWTPYGAFMKLWQSINGKDSLNPWVYGIRFNARFQNIDTISD